MHGAAATLTGVWDSLAGVSLGPLVLAVALHVAKLTAEARSWHWIVSHAHGGNRVRFRTTFGAFVSAIGANAVMPARVGEALRVGVVRRHIPGSSALTIAATVVLETAIEVAFGAAVIVAVLLAGRSVGSGDSGLVTRGLGAHPALLGAVAVLAIAATILGLAHRKRVQPLLARMAAGFSVVRSPRAFTARVLSWKLVAWTLRLSSVYVFLVAFHVPAAPWTALVVVAAQNVAASVPLLPGNAGTQQAAIGVALAGSASAAALLAFGVGMQAATTIADLALGAAALALVANRGDLRVALRSLRIGREAGAATAGS
jgi:glycosyltransferase 2 family protein